MTAAQMARPELTRKDWMSTLAKAAPADVQALLPDLPAHDALRAPEVGAVMVQGRVGGTGAPFNLGEMTVTRASVRLAACGTVGHAWVQGRDRAHALRAAVIDALMQTAAAASLQAQIAALAEAAQATKTTRAAKAAATKVEFFTMVRGDNE